MEQQDSCGFVKKEKILDDTIIDCHLSINIDVMLIKYGKRGWRVCISIRSVREKFIRFYIILFQTKLERKKKEGWNEIVGPSNRILCHRFDETDGRFRNKDFIAGQRSVSEISIVLFEHPRFAHSVVVDCIVFRTSSIRRPEGRRKGDEKERKKERSLPLRAASFAGTSYYRHFVSRISYPIISNAFSNLLIKCRFPIIFSIVTFISSQLEFGA